MTVKDFMSQEPVVVGPEATLAQASQAMTASRVGAVVVVDEGDIVGILTERDVVRAVAAGDDPRATSVRDYMSRGVNTVAPEDDMAAAAERMTAYRIRHLPVVDHGKLVGVISIRDIAAWSLPQHGQLAGGHPLKALLEPGVDAW